MAKKPIKGFKVLRNALSEKQMRGILPYVSKLLGRYSGDSPRMLAYGPTAIDKLENKDLMKLGRDFTPEKANGFQIMYQQYMEGYNLPAHTDMGGGKYIRVYTHDGHFDRKLVKVVILNLKGWAWFHLGHLRRKVQAGDIVVLEDEAIHQQHGVPAMPVERINVVMRYLHETEEVKLSKPCVVPLPAPSVATLKEGG